MVIKLNKTNKQILNRNLLTNELDERKIGNFMNAREKKVFMSTAGCYKKKWLSWKLSRDKLRSMRSRSMNVLTGGAINHMRRRSNYTQFAAISIKVRVGVESTVLIIVSRWISVFEWESEVTWEWAKSKSFGLTCFISEVTWVHNSSLKCSQNPLLAECCIWLRNLKKDYNIGVCVCVFLLCCTMYTTQSLEKRIAFCLHVYENGARIAFAYDVISNGSFFHGIMKLCYIKRFQRHTFQNRNRKEHGNDKMLNWRQSFDLSAFNHVFSLLKTVDKHLEHWFNWS